MKRQPTEWEKIFANEIVERGLIRKMYQQLMQLNIKKKPKTTQSKKWADLNKHIPKEDKHAPKEHMKRCSTSLLLEKCKSKPQ